METMTDALRALPAEEPSNPDVNSGPLSVAARAELSESHAAIQSLLSLVKDHGVRGVNIWHACDDEYDQHTFTVEVGSRRISDQTLPYVLMRAAGRMPTKFCTSCERDLDISLFVKRAANESGLGSICDECNRENVKRHSERRRARLQATLASTNPAA